VTAAVAAGDRRVPEAASRSAPAAGERSLPPGQGTADTPGSRRIAGAFAQAAADGRVALVPYVVAGYPDAATGESVALAAIDAGADLLELGLPYSDPLADGTTLQRAAAAALRAGATLERSLELLSRIHAARPAIPLVPMAYVNQVIGGAAPSVAMRRLADAGASGLILADLTPDEGAPVEAAAADAGLAIVYLVTPTTPPARRRAIAARSGGFLYCVSLVGVTGARSSLPPEAGRFVGAVRSESPIPVAVGFGVSRPTHVRSLGRVADGVIVASALVDALGPDGRDVAAMARLVGRLRAATRKDRRATPLRDR
jgi:tryptophan synthase alpha chain